MNYERAGLEHRRNLASGKNVVGTLWPVSLEAALGEAQRILDIVGLVENQFLGVAEVKEPKHARQSNNHPDSPAVEQGTNARLESEFG